jgi:hypothetical protein
MWSFDMHVDVTLQVDFGQTVGVARCMSTYIFAQHSSDMLSIAQGVLAEDGISAAERRAAAESLGVLARLGSDVYAARLVCVLVILEIGIL